MKTQSIQSSLASWALAFVLAWFGASEIISPANWVSFVPDFLNNASVNSLVIAHGILLTLAALLIALNFWRRIFAAIAALMLASIVFTLISQNGLNPVAVRDIGLFGLALSLVFFDKNIIVSQETPHITTRDAAGIFPEKYQ